ncbi:hypothetical protein ACFPYI_12385 [Halomarina salina]|uniref:Uncharacterized protein n=1 Tax=Halomarina salina TaxID=1872699 RepID=A0ABD5RPC2_9EURY|nr:hypothetical protein [Halomarina salina]
MIVGLGPSFDILSRVVEEYESHGQAVENVEVRTTDTAAGRLEATLELPVSFCPAPGSDTGARLEPTTATPTGPDGVRIEFSTPMLDGLDEATANAVDTRVEETVVTDDGVVLTVRLCIDPSEGGPAETPPSTAGAQTVTVPPEDDSSADDPPAPSGDDDRDPAIAERLATVRDETLPPYEDTAFLTRLYESCDTFAEMNRYVEMDVSTETVRRYMIDAGVHTAVSYETTARDARQTDDRQTDDRVDGGATTDEETVDTAVIEHGFERIADETVSHPDGVTLDDLVAAVCASVTVYQVQQRLGLDRRTTRRLLGEFDLLEFVVHRISDDPRRETSSEEVLERIAEKTTRPSDSRSVV